MSTLPDIPDPPAPARLPDEDLMLLITQGVIEAPVAELFRRHNRALFNFIAWSCQGNSAEAEDICQKTWLKLMRCASYQPRAPFRAFLYQIARNLLIDLRRSAYAQHDSLDEFDERDGFNKLAAEMPESDITPETELALRQNLHRVRQAMMRLPVLQREVVVLRFFAELSLDEIATAVGAGFETVKSRLRYAFAQLRQELG